MRTRVVVLFASLLIAATSCTSTLASNTSSPSPSPTEEASPSPSSSPTSAPTPVASPSPSQSAAAPTITGIATHNGEVGVIYLAVTLEASGGTPPYSWSGSGLPPGLSVSPSGVLTGTNSKAGTFPFTVTVTDSAGGTASANSKMTVFPPFVATSLCATACNVGVGCTTCGTFGAIGGGAGPYVFKLISGAPPAGMTWNGRLSLIGGFAAPPPPNLTAGPPRAPAPFKVSVTDDFQVTRTVTASWNVFPAINFSPTTTAPYAGCYQPGNGNCNITASGYSLAYTLGNPSDSVTVLVVKACYDNPQAVYICSTDAGAGPLSAYIPPGWTATAKGGAVTASMNCGNPDQCAAKTGGVQWFGDVFIVLVDKGACVAPANAQSALTADINIDF